MYTTIDPVWPDPQNYTQSIQPRENEHREEKITQPGLCDTVAKAEMQAINQMSGSQVFNNWHLSQAHNTFSVLSEINKLTYKTNSLKTSISKHRVQLFKTFLYTKQ